MWQLCVKIVALQTVRDWHLIIVTLLIAGFGTLLVTLQVAIPQLQPTPQLILDNEHGTERDVRSFCAVCVKILMTKHKVLVSKSIGYLAKA